jgi:hypothetical protein
MRAGPALSLCVPVHLRFATSHRHATGNSSCPPPGRPGRLPGHAAVDCRAMRRGSSQRRIHLEAMAEQQDAMRDFAASAALCSARSKPARWRTATRDALSPAPRPRGASIGPMAMWRLARRSGISERVRAIRCRSRLRRSRTSRYRPWIRPASIRSRLKRRASAPLLQA